MCPSFLRVVAATIALLALAVPAASGGWEDQPRRRIRGQVHGLQPLPPLESRRHECRRVHGRSPRRSSTPIMDIAGGELAPRRDRPEPGHHRSRVGHRSQRAAAVEPSPLTTWIPGSALRTSGDATRDDLALEILGLNLDALNRRTRATSLGRYCPERRGRSARSRSSSR